MSQISQTDQKDPPFGNLGIEDIRALEALRSRLMPLVSNLGFMQAQVYKQANGPPDW
jgi:hypothetical protein